MVVCVYNSNSAEVTAHLLATECQKSPNKGRVTNKKEIN